MINCLTDYIGLKQVQDSPSSGLYVNDLHGITTEQFELSREIDENDGADAAWDTLEKRAIRSFETDLIVKLKKYFKNYTQINGGVTGFVDDNQTADHGSGVYSGWLFDLSSYSQHLKLEINDIKINLLSAQTFNLKIFDANTGTELYTKSITGTVGLQTVKILQEFAVYDHNKIFVCYDTVEPKRVYADLEVPAAISANKISTTSSVLAESLDAAETGLIIRWNLKCSIEEFVCARLELFSEPYLYKLGVEFLRSSKYSSVLNRYTLMDLPTKDALIEEYKEEYQNILDGIFKDLSVPDDGICYICNKETTKRALIP